MAHSGRNVQKPFTGRQLTPSADFKDLLQLHRESPSVSECVILASEMRLCDSQGTLSPEKLMKSEISILVTALGQSAQPIFLKMTFESVFFQHLLQNICVLTIIELWKEAAQGHFFIPYSFVIICVCTRWPVLSARQLQVCFVLVQRRAPPHAKPPCDPPPHAATDRSSPYCRTCDRRCGWPAPGGWRRGAELWPWGEEEELI